MAKQKGSKGGVGAGKKPKHSGDANRPSKGSKGLRDASTVRAAPPLARARACIGMWVPHHPIPAPCCPGPQVRRLEMYKTRPVRDKKGRILHEVGERAPLPRSRRRPGPAAGGWGQGDGG
jgi:nuclear GTP-binding protein